MKEQREGTLIININLTPSLLALLALVLLATSLVVYLVWGQGEAAASSSEAPLAASTGARQYYLSAPVLNATQALTACANGYHMASLWEILDTSNLRYNTSLGVWQGDSGSGPPTVWQGWVRTGYGGYTLNTAGVANCNAWASNNPSHYGTTAGLPANWTAGIQDIHVWAVSTWTCDDPGHVWCVED
jgi:hypothetical protein